MDFSWLFAIFAGVGFWTDCAVNGNHITTMQKRISKNKIKEMTPKQQLLNLITNEFNDFKKLNFGHSIVPNSIPIVWFGNVEEYLKSELKIITVSLNPSDIEFKINKSSQPTTNLRFPDYNGSIESLYTAYNNYFLKNPYNSWFKASFGAVLASFDASYYDNAHNTALHTDIGCSYATSPTWTGLTNSDKNVLEHIGAKSWHNLVKILEPDVILFSASKNYENKITFPQVGKWTSIDVKSKSPLLKGTFKISQNKNSFVLFQVQGRKPFLQTSKEEKLKFKAYLI